MNSLRLAALPAVALLAACGGEPEAAEAPVPANATAASASPQTPAMLAYAQANDRMHAAMGGAIDSDPDVAFVQGMIPHHRGAVEMAEVVLEHGDDAETRALAETVIRTQSAEIAQMEAWLDARGLTAAPAAAPMDHSGH